MINKKETLVSFLFSFLMVCVAPPALAQQIPLPENDRTVLVSSKTDALVLEEIIVTAQKRKQGLQDVPVAVSVLGGDKISDMGIINLQEMAAYIPNVVLSSNAFGSGLFIRGIGSGINFGFEQSVSMFQDGIYWGRSTQMQAPLYDLDRVEVLKGPQGVLFGKNSVAGAISMISARPHEELEVQVDVGAGSFEQRKLKIGVGGSITPWLQGRLALYSFEGQGWTHNAFTSQDEPAGEQFGTRLSFTAQHENGWRSYVKFDWSGIESIGQSYEVIGVTPLQISLPPFIESSIPPHLDGVESSYNDRSNYGNSEIPGRRGFEVDVDYSNHAVEFERDLDLWDSGDNVVFTALTGYSSYGTSNIADWDYVAADVFGGIAREEYSQLSQEFRFTSTGDSAFQYIAGMYLQKSELEVDASTTVKMSTLFEDIMAATPSQLSALQLAEGTFENTYALDTDTAAVFFQGTLALNDRVRVTLGARYSYETKEVKKSVIINTFSGLSINAGTLASQEQTDHESLDSTDIAIRQALDTYWSSLLDVYPYATNDERTEKYLTPELTLEWDANDNTLFYASVKRGFKSGGFDNMHTNGEKLDQLEFEEEKSKAMELGAKFSLWDKRATVNVAIYHIAFEDLQVSIYNGTNGFLVDNAAEATSQGVELEGQFKLTNSLLLDASLASSHFEFDAFDKGPCTVGQQGDHLLAQQAARETSTSNDDGVLSMGCFQDMQGLSTSYSPELSASLRLTHHINIGQKFSLMSSIDINYSGSHFLDQDLDSGTYQSAFTKVNLRTALLAANGWQLAFTVKNLMDERTLTSAGDLPFSNGNFYAEAICSQTPFLCRQVLDQAYDATGSFFGITEAPRTYTVDVTYRM